MLPRLLTAIVAANRAGFVSLREEIQAALKTLPPVQAEKLQSVLSRDYGGFGGVKNKSKVPRVRVVVARHMRESDFRRVAPPPLALPNALVDEL